MDQLHRATPTMNVQMNAEHPPVERRIGFEVGTLNGVVMDWNLGKDLQLQTPAGLLFYDGWPCGVIGAAVQYDPPTPLQINLGVHLFISLVFPKLSAAFLW